jgi:hypothetical protein
MSEKRCGNCLNWLGITADCKVKAPCSHDFTDSFYGRRGEHFKLEDFAHDHECHRPICWMQDTKYNCEPKEEA